MHKKILFSLLIFLTVIFDSASHNSISEFRGNTAHVRIVVTDRIAIEGIEPLGLNLTTVAGGTNFATNNLIVGSGMEPAVGRYLVRVEEAGAGWMSWTESLGGVHMWDMNSSG